jgi:hypothetical protein
MEHAVIGEGTGLGELETERSPGRDCSAAKRTSGHCVGCGCVILPDNGRTNGDTQACGTERKIAAAIRRDRDSHHCGSWFFMVFSSSGVYICYSWVGHPLYRGKRRQS